MMQIDLSLRMQTGSNLPMLIGLRSLKLITCTCRCRLVVLD